MAETQYIISAIDGFKAIAGLLSDDHALTIDQAMSITGFYSQHKCTNALIAEAEILAHADPEALIERVGMSVRSYSQMSLYSTFAVKSTCSQENY